jgi:hypothetical protein
MTDLVNVTKSVRDGTQGCIRAQPRAAEAHHDNDKRSDDGDRRAAEKEVEPTVKREMFRASIGIW